MLVGKSEYGLGVMTGMKRLRDGLSMKGLVEAGNDEIRAEQSETDCRRQPEGKRSASMRNDEVPEVLRL
jgi:hypothetical protein